MKTKNDRIVLSSLVLFLFVMIACDVVEGTADVPGKVDQFDPIASLPAVSAFAGKDLLLVEISARYVRPDGTLNLAADYQPTVTYTFFGEAEPEAPVMLEKKPDTPLGVKRTSQSKEVIPHWQYIIVYIRNPHWDEYELNGEPVREWHAGMQRTPSAEIYDYDQIKKLESGYRALPEPLSISRIWKQAIEAGAPAENVVANISFKEGSYLFHIDGTGYQYAFDGDGRLVK